MTQRPRGPFEVALQDQPTQLVKQLEEALQLIQTQATRVDGDVRPWLRDASAPRGREYLVIGGRVQPAGIEPLRNAPGIAWRVSFYERTARPLDRAMGDASVKRLEMDVTALTGQEAYERARGSFWTLGTKAA